MSAKSAKILCLGLCICHYFLTGNNPGDSSLIKKRRLITALPVIYYTPETRFAFGASGVFIFNFKSDTVNAVRSSLSLNAIYTQNKQILFTLPYNLFIRNRKWQTYGELTYNRFNYNFYGVGNEMPDDYVERYGVEFPRIRFTILKKAAPNLYVGLRYAYDKYRLFDLDSLGVLRTGNIPGADGGTVSGFGTVMLYDSRDNIFYPGRGMWSEFVVYHDNPKTGSTFNYTRLTFDFVKYISLQQNIFALNFYSVYATTDLPFFQMASLGGLKKMRGFYEGRYRDNNALLFQAEYRRMVIGPLGFAVFASTGQVAKRYNTFNADNWRFTYGAGLRLMIDPKQKITIRLDAAIGNGQVLPYFTIGEAF